MVTGYKLREKAKKHAKHTQGISHPWRLAIMYLLAHKSMEVRDIVENIDLPQNLVAHHLKKMQESGWISKMRVGSHVTYTLEQKAFFDLTSIFAGTPFERNILIKLSSK